MTATTCDTGGGLLRAVLADPGSDDSRLIYADYLDEQGEADRAEFVRLAVAVAANGGYPEGCREPHPNAIVGCGRCDHCRLTMRLDELTGHAPDGTHTPDVLRFVWDGPGWCWAYRPYPDSPPPAGCPEFTIARGWPWRVACDLNWFLEHARDLFAAHPLEHVVLTDREPHESVFSNQPESCRWMWIWNDRTFRAAGATLPDGLYHKLRVKSFRDGGHDWAGYPSPVAAHAALSAAAVSLGRELANLPPLEAVK